MHFVNVPKRLTNEIQLYSKLEENRLKMWPLPWKHIILGYKSPLEAPLKSGSVDVMGAHALVDITKYNFPTNKSIHLWAYLQETLLRLL